jgi:hypothetical protein
LGSKRGKSDWGFAETGSGGNDELYCLLDAEWAASVNGGIEEVSVNKFERIKLIAAAGRQKRLKARVAHEEKQAAIVAANKKFNSSLKLD